MGFHFFFLFNFPGEHKTGGLKLERVEIMHFDRREARRQAFRIEHQLSSIDPISFGELISDKHSSPSFAL